MLVGRTYLVLADKAATPIDRIALRKLIKQTAKKSGYQVDPFNHIETAALLRAARADEKPIIEFWLETGLRPGEMLAATWSAVDWTHNRIRIEANLVIGLVNGKITQVAKPPKTGAGNRDVDLTARAAVRYRNPYQLRHTYASTLLTAGANPYWVAHQLGHVDVEMVFKIYGKFIPLNYQRANGFTRDSHQSATDGGAESITG